MNATEKDVAQDARIEENALRIARNEEAIKRQTEALEKIRDHYYPKKRWWKKLMGFFGKVVCVIVAYLGVAEALDWMWNTRKSSAMAEQSARIAQRLFMRESDQAGAVHFLEKAVELDGDTIRYRISLAYVKGIATIADLFDLGRPLTDEERRRVDGILSEAIFLQEVAPKDPMPYILAAQALRLRRERAAAFAAIEKALSLAGDTGIVQLNACALYCSLQDFASARKQILAAERLNPTLPFILFWKGQLALAENGDWTAAQKCFSEMIRLSPRVAIAHLNLARCLMNGDKPDLSAARAELRQTLSLATVPFARKMAMFLTGETYEREGNLDVAQLWFGRALDVDGHFMKALTARARVAMKTKAWSAAAADLTTAIGVSRFDAALYRDRATAREALGDAAGAAADRKKSAALASLPKPKPAAPARP